MDSLAVLRNVVMSKGKVTYLDSNNCPVDKVQDAQIFLLGNESRFPKDEVTSYPNRQAKGFYTLAAVLLLLEYVQKDYSSYLKNSVAAGIVSVSFLDKKPLLDYLEGTTDSLPQAKQDTTTAQENSAPKRSVPEQTGEPGSQQSKRVVSHLPGLFLIR